MYDTIDMVTTHLLQRLTRNVKVGNEAQNVSALAPSTKCTRGRPNTNVTGLGEKASKKAIHPGANMSLHVLIRGLWSLSPYTQVRPSVDRVRRRHLQVTERTFILIPEAEPLSCDADLMLYYLGRQDKQTDATIKYRMLL